MLYIVSICVDTAGRKPFAFELFFLFKCMVFYEELPDTLTRLSNLKLTQTNAHTYLRLEIKLSPSSKSNRN